jgi:hypothetical protein
VASLGQTLTSYIKHELNYGVSQFFARFSAIEIVRFFLHGLFGVFPVALFPRLASSLGVFGALVSVILAGLLLYVIPVDRFSSGFRYYTDGFNEELMRLTHFQGPKDSGLVRQIYDVFFFRDLPEAIRYRIQFNVSVYYLYSRIALAGLFYVALFIALASGLAFPPAAQFLTNEFGDGTYLLMSKFILLITLEFTVAFFSWRYANRTIRMTANVEMAASRVYYGSLKEIFDKYSEHSA